MKRPPPRTIDWNDESRWMQASRVGGSMVTAQMAVMVIPARIPSCAEVVMLTVAARQRMARRKRSASTSRLANMPNPSSLMNGLA